MESERALNSMASNPAPPPVAAYPDYASVGAPGFTPLKEHPIKIGKTLISNQLGSDPVEIFSMTLGQETIPLLPLRNWEQLDVHRWCARGKLPSTPPGLEIALDHVKMAGEIVSPRDANGCQRLQQLFSEWLALEKGTAEQARAKTHSSSAPPQSTAPRPERMRFHVEADKRGQVHIQCLQGKEQVASVGLSAAGINSLVNQGLMRKPVAMKVGALHDWIELDGSLCSFEKGHDDRTRLEQLLNDRYVPNTNLGQGKNVVIFANAASSTGFDIQFPVTVAGASETRRRHLAEDALEVLQDSERCGLLQPGRLVKLTRPCLIFKEKTQDGGERYLQKRPENVVVVVGDDGTQKEIDLSRPVNYMHLSAVELTALFNHPAINRHSSLLPTSSTPAPATTDKPITDSPPPRVQLEPTPTPAPPRQNQPPLLEPAKPSPAERGAEKPLVTEAPPVAFAPNAEPEKALTQSAQPAPILPNQWLENVLAQPPLRHEWLASLLYTRLARQFGNSREGTFGASACWAIALSPIKHIEEPDFKGIFLTEKRGLGYLNAGHLARFNKGVAFLGTQELAIEGIDIRLVGVGVDAHQRIVFVVNDGYRPKFGLPDSAVRSTLMRLQEQGAVVMSVQELVQSTEPIEILWTVPEEQENPNDPQVLETCQPV